jgi:hypothetical protein
MQIDETDGPEVVQSDDDDEDFALNLSYYDRKCRVPKD